MPAEMRAVRAVCVWQALAEFAGSVAAMLLHEPDALGTMHCVSEQVI